MRIFSFKKMVLSFKYAIRGLKFVILNQQSFRLQSIAAAGIIFLMFYFPLSSLSRAILFLTIFLVLSLEITNSVFEKTIDILKPEFNHDIGIIKDMAAGAVLLAAVGSIIIGILIFLPYF